LKKPETPFILMVDDDSDDCLLATDAFEQSGAEGSLVCVEDGYKLLDFLSGTGDYEGKNGLPPAVILLDLNMPGKGGCELLREIKDYPQFRKIPIVVFTTSREEQIVDKCLRLGARSFVTKPADFSDWIRIMRSLADKWIESGQP
jgi:CheY-like chemotaxis protein